MRRFLRSDNRVSMSIVAAACIAAGCAAGGWMITTLSAAEPDAGAISVWIEPCSVMIAACEAGDAELARWALQAWEKGSGRRLHFVETKNRSEALLRVFWAGKNSGLYGETVPTLVNGRRGAELHIMLPDPPGDDRLLRDTVVYLTCLHESGHALGLRHTRAFDDIMYNFQYGGDIAEYFGRYRRKLTAREDIRKYSGMSPADQSALIESIDKGVFR
jgi:hypothetical protein